jgi:hypothetical protein
MGLRFKVLQNKYEQLYKDKACLNFSWCPCTSIKLETKEKENQKENWKNCPQLYKQNERFFKKIMKELTKMRRVTRPFLPVVNAKKPTMGGIVPPSLCCYKQK